jgi:hypothetical protein
MIQKIKKYFFIVWERFLESSFLKNIVLWYNFFFTILLIVSIFYEVITIRRIIISLIIILFFSVMKLIWAYMGLFIVERDEKHIIWPEFQYFDENEKKISWRIV